MQRFRQMRCLQNETRPDISAPLRYVSRPDCKSQNIRRWSPVQIRKKRTAVFQRAGSVTGVGNLGIDQNFPAGGVARGVRLRHRACCENNERHRYGFFQMSHPLVSPRALRRHHGGSGHVRGQGARQSAPRAAELRLKSRPGACRPAAYYRVRRRLHPYRHRRRSPR